MNVLIICNGNLSTKPLSNSLFALNQAKATMANVRTNTIIELDMRSIRRRRKLGFQKDSYDGVPVYRIAIPCGSIPILLSFLARIGIGYCIKKIIKSIGKPDIIHAHFGLTGFWAVSAKKKYEIPLVLTEHNSGMIRENRTKTTEAFSRKAYAAADKLIAVGNMLKDSMTDLTGKDITVIPNVLPHCFYYKNAPKAQNFTYISVGAFIKRKRFDITIKAFSIVNRKNRDTRLLLIGTGELKNELTSLVKNSEMTDMVDFLGSVPNDELPDIYNACHCFVLPSMCETFGVVYAEAMACGLPIIATRCGGPEDFVDDNCGLLIPVDDVNATAEAMAHMYHNNRVYDSVKISSGILRKVSEECVGNRLVEVYSKLVEEKV